jgi:Ca2+-transporting ATPase
MTVVEAYVNNTYYKQNDFNKDNQNQELRLLASGMSLCSNATVDEGLYGDPTEIALVVMANEFNMHKSVLETVCPRVDELPFDSVRKMMSTKHEFDGKTVVFTKGALDSIMARTTMILDGETPRKITKADITKINDINMEYADKALRVLALAYSESDKITEENLIFVGLVAMIDPARPEAKPAVEKFKEAGITTVMITGDHKDTAFAIARELGIAETKEQCMLGSEVDKLTEDELVEATKTIRVFSRVSPENKVQIVKAFQKAGNICAMTGDGVNDAPSIKAADIGISMGITGTDVTKGASDMVLADDNFATIVNAVEEGRKIYDNVRKVLQFQLSTNMAEVVAIFTSSVLGVTMLTPAHLLWINMVTDSAPGLALGMEKAEGDLMKRKPRNSNDSVFSDGAGIDMILQGLFMSALIVLSYFIGEYMETGAINLAISSQDGMSMAFLTCNFVEMFHAICMRSQRQSIFKLKSFNWWLFGAFILTTLLTVGIIYIPFFTKLFDFTAISFKEFAVAFGLAFLVVPAIEIIKFFQRKFKK